ncbi:MAG: hypothetical protein KY459_07265 [Acidobacteria bacterium]|nr:hypothetical protein [Acidobacteriota bacterium]
MTEHSAAPASASSRSVGLAIITAVGASLCCIGPILAATFGVSSLAALSKYGFLRPWLAVLTVVLLGISFYLAYRKPKECRTGSVCETHGTDRIQRWNRVVLWTATIIIALVLTFPEWSVLIL